MILIPCLFIIYPNQPLSIYVYVHFEYHFVYSMFNIKVILKFLLPILVNQHVQLIPVITEIYKIHNRRYKMIAKRYIAPGF